MRLCILILLFVPWYTHAAVLIHEVAWMGTTASANDEWIELYNEGGSSVSVEGWKLTDSMNLEIVLSGTIAPGSYAVLERTDDDTAPGSAFLIYTGALANTGATLRLERSDGSLEDQVAGGENWGSIGGDNITKETSQYTPTGWITGKPTPGAKNIDTGTVSEEDDTQESDDTDDTDDTDEAGTDDTPESSSAKSKSAGKESTAKFKVKDTELTITLLGPERVYVNQPVKYTVESTGVGPTINNSLQYAWSFGSLESAFGREVHHTFAYAGEYVVAVEAHFAKHTVVARKTVTVLPTMFVLSEKENGDILLHNNAKYEVDISGYTLGSIFTKTFPKNTVILPGATITIPRYVLKSAGLVLRDQKGAVVARLGVNKHMFPQLTPEVLSERTSAQSWDTADIDEVSMEPSLQPQVSNFLFESDVVASEETVSSSVDTGQIGANLRSQKPDAVTHKQWPYALLGLLILCGTLAVVVSAQKKDI
jgi:hypothetical protein